MTPEFQAVLIAAMDNAKDGITISDVNRKDNPLIFVNEGFLQMTGYSREEIIGSNCRFLQGQEKQQRGVLAIREAIKKQESVVVELLNFKKDGTPFWNNLSLTPIFDTAGSLTHYIGVQNDVTAIKEKEALSRNVERQQMISEISFEAQEKERKSIGAELHDNINQLLAAARLQLNVAIGNPEMQDKLMRSSMQIIDSSIAEIRKLSHKLVGALEKNFSLKDSLNIMLDQINVDKEITFSFTSDEFDEHAVEENKKLALYRVAQEQVNNIIKYANATEVQVQLRKDDDDVELCIQDNGVGFDVRQQQKGIGLMNIENRIEMLKGRMHLVSSPGNGCTIKITLPA